MLLITSQDDSLKRTNRIISTPSDSRKNSGNHISRIDTPGMNKDVWSVIDTASNVLSDTNNVKKFDTSVQSSTTQERKIKLSQIQEESLKSIFPELGTELDSSVRVNLANSVVCKSPKFKASGTRPLRQRIYGTSITSVLLDQRTVTGCGGSRTGMIGWDIRMVLKL